MEDVKNYIDIMLDTLKKKANVLVEIEKIAVQQTQTLNRDKINVEEMIDQLEKKDVLIKELDRLDEGFEAVYQRAHEEMKDHKEQYKDVIEQMQIQIKLIAELTVKLQVYEEKNRPKFVALFEAKKKEVKEFNINSRSAARYYKNMSNTHQDGQSYFMDKRK